MVPPKYSAFARKRKRCWTEDELSTQFPSSAFDFQKPQQGLEDDFDVLAKLPCRIVQHWQLRKSNDGVSSALRHRPCVSLPIDTEKRLEGYELVGMLKPMHTHQLPIPIALKNDCMQYYIIDKSRGFRGYWIITSIARYWLHEPCTKRNRIPRLRIRIGGELFNDNDDDNDTDDDSEQQKQQQPPLEHIELPSQEQMHAFHRAQLGLYSNLLDTFVPNNSTGNHDDTSYLDMLSQSTPKEVHKLLSPTTRTMESYNRLVMMEKNSNESALPPPLLHQTPFDLKLLMLPSSQFLNPYIEGIMDGSIMKKSKFFKAAKIKRKDAPGFSTEQLLASAKAAEARSQQRAWGESILNRGTEDTLPYVNLALPLEVELLLSADPSGALLQQDILEHVATATTTTNVVKHHHLPPSLDHLVITSFGSSDEDYDDEDTNNNNNNTNNNMTKSTTTKLEEDDDDDNDDEEAEFDPDNNSNLHDVVEPKANTATSHQQIIMSYSGSRLGAIVTPSYEDSAVEIMEQTKDEADAEEAKANRDDELQQEETMEVDSSSSASSSSSSSSYGPPDDTFVNISRKKRTKDAVAKEPSENKSSSVCQTSSSPLVEPKVGKQRFISAASSVIPRKKKKSSGISSYINATAAADDDNKKQKKESDNDAAEEPKKRPLRLRLTIPRKKRKSLDTIEEDNSKKLVDNNELRETVDTALKISMGYESASGDKREKKANNESSHHKHTAMMTTAAVAATTTIDATVRSPSIPRKKRVEAVSRQPAEKPREVETKVQEWDHTVPTRSSAAEPETRPVVLDNGPVTMSIKEELPSPSKRNELQRYDAFEAKETKDLPDDPVSPQQQKPSIGDPAVVPPPPPRWNDSTRRSDESRQKIIERREELKRLRSDPPDFGKEWSSSYQESSYQTRPVEDVPMTTMRVPMSKKYKLFSNPKGSDTRPVCAFFWSVKGCRNGDSCRFLHTSSPPDATTSDNTIGAPIRHEEDKEEEHSSSEDRVQVASMRPEPHREIARTSRDNQDGYCQPVDTYELVEFTPSRRQVLSLHKKPVQTYRPREEYTPEEPRMRHIHDDAMAPRPRSRSPPREWNSRCADGSPRSPRQKFDRRVQLSLYSKGHESASGYSRPREDSDFQRGRSPPRVDSSSYVGSRDFSPNRLDIGMDRCESSRFRDSGDRTDRFNPACSDGQTRRHHFESRRSPSPQPRAAYYPDRDHDIQFRGDRERRGEEPRFMDHGDYPDRDRRCVEAPPRNYDRRDLRHESSSVPSGWSEPLDRRSIGRDEDPIQARSNSFEDGELGEEGELGAVGAQAKPIDHSSSLLRNEQRVVSNESWEVQALDRAARNRSREEDSAYLRGTHPSERGMESSQYSNNDRDASFPTDRRSSFRDAGREVVHDNRDYPSRLAAGRFERASLRDGKEWSAASRDDSYRRDELSLHTGRSSYHPEDRSRSHPPSMRDDGYHREGSNFNNDHWNNHHDDRSRLPPVTQRFVETDQSRWRQEDRFEGRYYNN